MPTTLEKLFDDYANLFIEKNLDRVDKLFTEDCVFSVPQFKVALSGRAEIVQALREDLQKIHGYTYKKLFVCEEGDNLAVEWINHYHDPQGKKFQTEGVSIIKTRNRLVQSLREFVHVTEL